MSNIKISELTSASGLTGAELLPIVQENTTVKTTVQDIVDLAGGGGSSTLDILADGTVVNQNSNVRYVTSTTISPVSGNQHLAIISAPEIYLSNGTATTITLPTFTVGGLSVGNQPNLVTLSLPEYAIATFGGMVAFSVNQCPSLTTINIPALTTLPSGIWFNFNANALSQETVDHILVKFAATTAVNNTLYLDQGTNATPSATGLTAKATLLSRGWTVSTN